MIRTYVLPLETTENVISVAGSEYLHGGLMIYNYDSATVIQESTPEEDAALSALAIEVRDPTPQELAAFESLEPPIPPNPDILELQELLSTSPQVITMPDIWRSLRIIAKHLGLLG